MNSFCKIFQFQLMRKIVGYIYKHIKPRLQVIEIEAKRQARLDRIYSDPNWRDNPYYQINMEAEDNIEWSRKRNEVFEHWYNNPLRFVDAEDLFHEDGIMRSRKGIMAIAGAHFRTNRDGITDVLTDSLYGNVPGTKDIQKHVLKNMLRDSLTFFSKNPTKAQVEAFVLAREADRHGHTATIYIANERRTSREAAFMLLKRAEEAILLTSDTQNSIIRIEARIKERARDLPRVCAVCGNVCEDNLKALCNSCHLQYIYRDNYLDDVQREVIADNMRFSSLNHWRKARELVFAEE